MKISTEQAVNAYRQHNSTRKAAAELGVSKSGMFYCLKKAGVKLNDPGRTSPPLIPLPRMEHPHRIELEVRDGVVLVGSDAHIWPGEATTAQRAFSYFSHELDPVVTVLNGDVFDGARISRFPSIGWEHKPDVAGELAACKEVLSGFEGARKIWTLGNHDLRFETYIANHASGFAGVQGVHLKDHFPDWEPCWSVWINPGAGNSPVCIKHRFKGGTHARHNNVLYAGVNIVTGHLHNLGVTPWSDYWGVRFGVDSGTLAVPYGPQFVHYTEDNPVNWRSGFTVLTFNAGKLLWPEVVHVLDEGAGTVEFRGEVIHV